MNNLKNIPPRIALLQMLTERTGSVSRWELLITLKNMWTDDKEGEPLDFHFLGRCLSDLNASKYIRRTKKHSHFKRNSDLFIITEKGLSLLSGEIEDNKMIRGKTITHVSVIEAENKSKLQRMKDEPAAWNVTLRVAA